MFKIHTGFVILASSYIVNKATAVIVARSNWLERNVVSTDLDL